MTMQRKSELFSYAHGIEIGKRNAIERLKHRKKSVRPYFVLNGMLWVLAKYKHLNYQTRKYSTKVTYFPFRGKTY